MSVLSPFDAENVGSILAGSGDWFSAQLLRLIAKADDKNLALLRSVYPTHVAAYEKWCEVRR